MIKLNILNLQNNNAIKYKVDNMKIAEIHIAKFIYEKMKELLYETKQYNHVTYPDGKIYITSPRHKGYLIFDEMKKHNIQDMLPFHINFFKDKYNYIIEK